MMGRSIPRPARFFGALLLLLGVTGCATVASSPTGGAGQVAYVSVRGDGRVLVFDVGAETGEWTLKQTAYAREGEESWALSAPIAISPDGRRLDVGLRSAGGIATFEIADDGRLRFLRTTGIAGSAPYLTRDSTGRWLLAAYYADGKVTVHRVGADGTVGEGPVQEIHTGPNAHSILIDPSNRFVFVPHVAPNAVHQFGFDAETGALTPNDPPVVQPATGRGPRHSRFHPTLPIAYVINETASTVSTYRFDPGRGTLTERHELSTLPAGFAGTNSTADLHLTPDGRFLYGSNRGHDSIVAYRVEPGSGQLELVDWFETEPVPRAFAIDLTGRFLYAAGQESGRVAAYRIDQATGRLTRFATYDVGPSPTWIEFRAVE